jgi:carbamoyl-phosphate synthase large subunit
MTMPSPGPESADCHALRAGFTLDEIFDLTKIDRWFLTQMKEIVDFETELAVAND